MPPRLPRFERQLAADRRLALISATIASLQREGHDGLSVRRIAARAGVSIGLINHHFPKKEQLVAEAYKQFNRTLADGFRRAVERAPPSARARLRAFFRATFSRPNLDPNVLSAWVVFWGLFRHSPEIQRVHDEAYGGYVDLLRDLLAQFAREHGRLRMSLRLAAIGLNALLDGLWLEWCLAPRNFRASEAVTICESWVESLLHPIKTPG
jgi:TetR/AcrR family transcriptional regulator, transcriptional repressor of bet genes